MMSMNIIVVNVENEKNDTTTMKENDDDEIIEEWEEEEGKKKRKKKGEEEESEKRNKKKKKFEMKKLDIEEVIPTTTTTTGTISSSYNNYNYNNSNTSRRSESGSGSENRNALIIEHLSKLLGRYRAEGDKWRIVAYNRAIKSIAAYPRPITSGKQAQLIPGIGRRIAEKIDEILSTGELQKAKEIPQNMDESEFAARKVFTSVWGAGPATVNAWIKAGFRSLADLKTAHGQTYLTSLTKIGVRYYDEFLKPIHRSEVEEFGKIIKEHLLSFSPDSIMEICGSYRRGRIYCRDIDILIGNQNPDGILQLLLPRLKKHAGIITDDITTSWSKGGSSNKYMGVARLTWGHPHRRIDIKVYSLDQWPTALLYFTGSGVFNQELRTRAKSKGFHLSDTSLVRLQDSTPTPIPIRSENDIFKTLNLPYIEPNKREYLPFY